MTALRCTVLLGMLGLALSMRPPIGRQHPIRAAVVQTSPLQAWSLLYREFKPEFLTCIYGQGTDDSIMLKWTTLAAVRPSQLHKDGIDPPFYCPIVAGPDSLIGFAHSHPSGVCAETGRDIRTFALTGLAVSVVVCGRDRIAVFLRDMPAVLAPVCSFDAEQSDTIPLHCKAPGDDRAPAGPAPEQH